MNTDRIKTEIHRVTGSRSDEVRMRDALAGLEDYIYQLALRPSPSFFTEITINPPEPRNSATPPGIRPRMYAIAGGCQN
ncbi:MAG TPA: hypothetical protein VN418_05100 [Gammaproteobacteria bacterium]|nr:hypothetical protein [Gammaproteobacteria bacterium]